MSIISREQDTMIDMLLQGDHISDIAKTIGCTRQTVYTWKDKPHIKAEIDNRRQQLKKSAHNRITKDVCTYVDNIKELANESTDQRVRLQANKYLIDQCLGTAQVAKDDKIISEEGNSSDNNTLKKELDSIKNLKVV